MIPIMVLTSLPQCNEEKLLGEGATAYFEKGLLTRDCSPWTRARSRSLKPSSACSPRPGKRRRPLNSSDTVPAHA